MTAVYEVLERHEQDSPAWHEARRSGLGASEVAAVLGLSKWQTPLDVYLSKMGVPHQIDEDRAYFGHALEPVIAGWLTRKHLQDLGAVEDGFAARSTLWPWLTASPDRTSLGRPIELKTSSGFAREAWKEGVPVYYQVQVQVQLAVLGAARGWLAVLHDGNSPDLHVVERDEEWIRELLVPLTRAFWEEHVLAQVPPAPTTSAEAVSLWPGDPEVEPLDADDDDLDLWRQLRHHQATKAASEKAEDALKLELQKRLGQATVLRRDGAVIATWKPQAGARRLDGTSLKRDHPDLAAEYTVQGAPQRRFLVKDPKEALV